MKITCTIKEFGRLVRDCERGECWKCPLTGLCDGKETGIEHFVSVVVADEELETGGVSDG